MKKPIALFLAAAMAASSFTVAGVSSASAAMTTPAPVVLNGAAETMSNVEQVRDRRYRSGRHYRGGRNYYRSGRHYRGDRRYYSRRRDNDSGALIAGGIIGLATGAIIGGALSQQQPRYYGGGGGGSDWLAYCSQRYRSFDPGSGTYLGYDGRRHYCR